MQSAVGSSPEARSRPALGSRPRPANPGQHSQTPKQQASAHLTHRQPSTQEQPSSPKQGPSSHASLEGLGGMAGPPGSPRQRQQGSPDDGLVAQFLGSPWAARNATGPPDSPGNVHTAHGSLGVHPGRSSTDGALGSYAFSPRGAVDPGTTPRARASYSGRDALIEPPQRSSSGTPEPSSPGRTSNLETSVGRSADDSSGAKSARALLPRVDPSGAHTGQPLHPRSSLSGSTGPPSPHPSKGPGPARPPDSLNGSGYQQQQQQQQSDRQHNLEAYSVGWAAEEPGPGLGQQWRAARNTSAHAGGSTSAGGSFLSPQAYTPSEQRRAQTYGGDSSPYSQLWPIRADAFTPGGHDLRQQQPTTSASLPLVRHTATTPHWQAPLPAATPAARPATYFTPAPPAYTPLGAMSTPDLAAWPFHASPAPSSSAVRLGTQSRTLAVTDGEEVGLQLLPRYPSAKCDLIDLP